MRIEFRHKGKKFKRPEWPKDEYFTLKSVCQEYLVIQYPGESPTVMERDDNDTNWEFA